MYVKGRPPLPIDRHNLQVWYQNQRKRGLHESHHSYIPALTVSLLLTKRHRAFCSTRARETKKKEITRQLPSRIQWLSRLFQIGQHKAIQGVARVEATNQYSCATTRQDTSDNISRGQHSIAQHSTAHLHFQVSFLHKPRATMPGIP